MQDTGTARELQQAAIINAFAAMPRQSKHSEMAVSSLTQVIAPKGGALAHLLPACTLQPVARAVLFSSVASLLGSAGQAAYAAANGSMDGWAAAAAAKGCTAISVQWGAWAAPGVRAATQACSAAEGRSSQA